VKPGRFVLIASPDCRQVCSQAGGGTRLLSSDKALKARMAIPCHSIEARVGS